jgi:hypothetical protein
MATFIMAMFAIGLGVDGADRLDKNFGQGMTEIGIGVVIGLVILVLEAWKSSFEDDDD